jgi:hypothetical protein
VFKVLPVSNVAHQANDAVQGNKIVLADYHVGTIHVSPVVDLAFHAVQGHVLPDCHARTMYVSP